MLGFQADTRGPLGEASVDVRGEVFKGEGSAWFEGKVVGEEGGKAVLLRGGEEWEVVDEGGVCSGEVRVAVILLHELRGEDGGTAAGKRKGMPAEWGKRLGTFSAGDDGSVEGVIVPPADRLGGKGGPHECRSRGEEP